MVNLRLRLPEGLRQRLADEAEEAGRSLNSEILWRLGHTFAGERWDEFVAEAEQQEQRRQELLEEMRLRPELQASLTKILAKFKEQKKRKS
jgi:hypothetical protein